MTIQILPCVPGFTIGCDPEVFIRDASGAIVSADGLIPGDKATPHKVPGGAIQVDGLAAEFNIDPANSFDEFNSNILSVLRALKAQLPKGYGLHVVEAHEFDKAYYDTLPDDAKVLGCEPDYNAYEGGAPNPRPDNATSLRGAAGHIHLGWGADIPVDHPEHLEVCCDIVKQLDRYAGVLDRAFTPTNRRREAYGKAGAFRPKPYGVEYRVPSNTWIMSVNRRRSMWNAIMNAITDMQAGKFRASDISRQIIDTNVYNTGTEVLDYYYMGLPNRVARSACWKAVVRG